MKAQQHAALLRFARLAMAWGVCLRISAVDAYPLVIDPGHGGVDPGAASAVAGFWEKTVNLRVSLALQDTLTWLGCVKDYHYYLTREDDTTSLSLADRAAIAMSRAASEFICIHHNGWPVPSVNYTRVNYCTDMQTWTSPPLWRDTSALLASKVGHRIVQSFGLDYSQCPGSVSWPCDRCELVVLHRTTMASAYTEASFITNPAEANAFLYGTRAQQEAGAIFHGWRSYKSGGGFAFVHNAYNGGPQFPVHFGVTFWANDRCGSLVKPLTRGGWACARSWNVSRSCW